MNILKKCQEAVFEEVFPDDKATDLKAVIDAYDLILENIPPGQKKPVVVIGAPLQY